MSTQTSQLLPLGAIVLAFIAAAAIKTYLNRRAGQTCVCGCSREVHQHYRRETDCPTCGCKRYRRSNWLRRLLDRRRGVRQVREAWDQRDRKAS
jgi:hypothetical protein